MTIEGIYRDITSRVVNLTYSIVEGRVDAEKKIQEIMDLSREWPLNSDLLIELAYLMIRCYNEKSVDIVEILYIIQKMKSRSHLTLPYYIDDNGDFRDHNSDTIQHPEPSIMRQENYESSFNSNDRLNVGINLRFRYK